MLIYHLCSFKFPDCEDDLSQSHLNVNTFSNLATHTKIYTDAKLFKCDLCDNEFTQSGSLTIHKQSHAGIKSLKLSLIHI